MGTPVKCADCDAQWYRIGRPANAPCIDCGSTNVDVDTSPSRTGVDDEIDVDEDAHYSSN